MRFSSRGMGLEAHEMITAHDGNPTWIVNPNLQVQRDNRIVGGIEQSTREKEFPTYFYDERVIDLSMVGKVTHFE